MAYFGVCGDTAETHSNRRSMSLSTLSDSQQGCCLWIGDLSVWLDENWLRRTFASTKALVSCKVIRHKATQMSRGYGFLLFNSHEAASQVLNNLNGKLIPGTDQIFRLNWAANGRQSGAATTDYSLFVGDLVEEVSDYRLQEAFRQFYSSVRSAKVMRAPLSGRSRNFGFVRFGAEAERDQALREMNGHEIFGRPVRVSLATAKKTQTPPIGQQGPSGQERAGTSQENPGNTTLFIGGLSDLANEEELRNMFSLFGELVSLKHLSNKNCAFVQFKDMETAKTAMNMLQDQVVAGAPIRISWGRQGAAPKSAMPYGPAQSYMYQGSQAPGAFPQARSSGMPMYLPVGLQGQGPQIYRGGYSPYIDDLTAAAAALNLGGQPLMNENQALFQQAGISRQPQIEGMDQMYQASYGGLQNLGSYPRGPL